MARSDEAEAFFVGAYIGHSSYSVLTDSSVAAVYEAIQEIPYGKVTSYGHIANLTGYPYIHALLTYIMSENTSS